MKKTIISSLLLLGCSLHAVESRIELRHREAEGVGYNTGYTSLDYFLMGAGESVEFLLDLRGHVFNNGHGAGNAGLGVRIPVKNDKWMVGVNAFYDVRQAPDLLCNQVGAGLEWLTKYFDVRTNGYIPIGKQKHTRVREFETLSGTTVKITQKLQAALPCIDAEIGTPLPRPFYFAIGAYYLFEQKEAGLDVGQAFGGRVRMDIDCGRYVTLGAVATYDHIFKTRVQGIVSINIPFEKNWRKCEESCQDDDDRPRGRNLRRVAIMRNEIIPIEDKKRSNTDLTDSDGDPIQFFFVSNNADFNGDGSFERPFASLKQAEKVSGPGDVIYVFPGDGTPRNMDHGIILKEDQILASSARPLVIEGVEIPAQTPNIAPILTNIHPDQPIVTNPGNSHLNDFLFIPPWEYNWGRENYAIDPFADARAEGFEVLLPKHSSSSETIYGTTIIEDYEAPSQETPAVPPTFESVRMGGIDVDINDDYGN